MLWRGPTQASQNEKVVEDGVDGTNNPSHLKAKTSRSQSKTGAETELVTETETVTETDKDKDKDRCISGEPCSSSVLF